MSLRKKALSGLVWTFTQQFSNQIINFVVSIILARFLSPAEFGLIGMLSIFISIGSTLMDSGLTSSLIRTPDADQRDYSTVFFINIIGSIIFYLLLFAAAPFIATFYKHEILTALIRVYALTFIIQAFVGVQSTRLTKILNFKTQLKIQVPSIIGGGILGIVLARMGYGAWSLVWMSLFQSLLSTIQHWIFAGWRPDFIFDKARFKHHFNFGYKMAISNLAQTFYNNIYTLIIGRYFSAAQVGYYTRSLSLRQLPISNLTAALSKVSFPMFSAINSEDQRLKLAYKRLMQQLVFWLTPLLILLAIVAVPFIRILLTDKWLPAVPYFQILCFAGIMYPLKFNLNILQVKGRSDLLMKLEIVKKTYGIIAVLFAVQYGIMGLLYCQLILDVVEFLVNSYYCGKMINYSVKEQLKDFVPSISLAAAVGLLTHLVDSSLIQHYNLGDAVKIIILGTLFMSVYLVISVLVNAPAINEFKQMFFKRYSKPVTT
ncbi:MAG: lipopolysaccharide biosynthesis protein [Mucilaginibacter sp.]|nr:lipopolysaccharide biosynthesis protein [Mucilaginibacter sp.]